MIYGFPAAVCWAAHFPLILRYLGDMSPLVFYFHSTFWAAAALITILTLSGNLDHISVVNRKSGTIFLLLLFGGYGFFMLLANAAERTENRSALEHLFYVGPLILILLAGFTRTGARPRQLGLGIVGFVGGWLVLYNVNGFTPPPAAAVLLILAAAASWAFFSFIAASLLTKNEVLPVLTIVFSLTAVCLLVTCIAMREDILAIEREYIWVTIVIGILPIAGAMTLWLKCMTSTSSTAAAASWWYGAVIPAALWYHFAIPDAHLSWIGAVGIALILASLKTSGKKRERTTPTFGDLISK